MKMSLKSLSLRTRRLLIGIPLVAVLLADVVFLVVSLVPKNNDKISIFIASAEVDSSALKGLVDGPTIKTVTISYCAPDDTSYAYKYMAARESRYDLFILRETELSALAVAEIFVPFDARIQSILNLDATDTYFTDGASSYGVRVFDGVNGNAAFSSFVSFGDESFYLCFALRSYNVGQYSSISNVATTDEHAFLAARLLLGDA